MAQPFQQSSIVIPVHPRECGQFHFCTVFPALTVYYLRFVKTIDALRHRVVIVAPNLLNQTFAPTAPNQVWVADLTYVATQEGWLYLAGIKDVYTCEIVGYAMGERMTKELTGKALFMALRSQRPPAGLIHHSDRGSQYCAYDYRVIQEQFGLKTSMSRKGNCYDNAPMESFWGTLKNESLSHYRFNNRDEAISVIREYIEIFYNRQRRHSRLGNISPAAFREKYHQMAA